MPLATSLMSAPSASQMLAISLMKEILVARKALEAYLIISAVRRSVMTIGARSARCNWATLSAASRSREPSTVRAGPMKSLMAAPSRRRADGDEDEFGLAQRLGVVGGEMQPAGGYVAMDDFL